MAKGLKQLPDDLKIKSFNMIVEKYGYDSTLSQFGDEVQKILRFLRELHEN